MKEAICLDIISKYRSQIMGMAIIWIVIFHFFKMIYPEYLFFFASIGYGGVDIFLFLSGLGLYYSWNKKGSNARISTYLRRRFLRVLPAFWIVVLGHDILTKSLSIDTFYKLTTLGLWLPIPHTYWFISAILVFYILFPLYIQYYNKYKWKCLIVAVLGGVFLTTLYSFYNHSDTDRNDIVFFLSRIPIFFIGISAGQLSLENKLLDKHQLIVLTILSVIAILFLYLTQLKFSYTFLQNTALNNYPFIILAPALSLFFAILFSYCRIGFNNVMSFLGSISLELYLIHLPLIQIYQRFVINTSQLGVVCIFLVFFLICVLISWLLSIFVKRTLSMLNIKV